MLKIYIQTFLFENNFTFISSALHKAGKHMENSIVASYAGLLLGTIIMDNKVSGSLVKVMRFRKCKLLLNSIYLKPFSLAFFFFFFF